MPQKLIVIFSSKIKSEIKNIEFYNENQFKAICNWHDYIYGMVRYISNPSIAFDYANRYSRWSNGAKLIEDFGYNIAYLIMNNYSTRQPYVYIFKANLNPEEFGLQVPPTLQENKKKVIRLTESHIRTIIRETLKRLLKL